MNAPLLESYDVVIADMEKFADFLEASLSEDRLDDVDLHAVRRALIILRSVRANRGPFGGQVVAA